jgi:aspartyl-tRNA(Asn)/glutamyl-tRNA(Gln) amidotransferase subunit A
VRAAVDAALAEYRKLGATTVEVSLPNARLAIPAYYVIAPAEASSNLSRFDGVRYGHRAAEYGDLNDMYCKSRAQGFGAEVKRRILVGTYVLSHGYYDAYYIKAQKLRRLIANDFAAAFEQCDVIAGPTVAPPWPSASARRPTTRCRCTSATSTPWPSTSPACPACRTRPASAPAACRWACS